MTTTYITLDLFGTENISASDELVVLQDVSILTSSTGIASTLASSYSADLFLYGTVIASSIGIDLFGTSTGLADGYGGHSVYVGQTGVLSSVFGGGTAALFGGTTNSFINYGEVSARGRAIDFEQGSGHLVMNYGSITSIVSYVVYFGSTEEFTPFPGTNTLNNSGIMSSLDGIFSSRAAINLTNSGEMHATGNTINIQNDDSGSTIINTGLIQAGNLAIGLGDANDTVSNSGQIFGAIFMSDGLNELTNTGYIEGEINSDGLVQTVITNTGTIVGDIHLGTGNDVFNGVGGIVQGTVYGGVGDDNYYISEAGVTLFEFEGQGIDFVYSTIDFTLGENFDNLTLIGGDDLNGNGNELANVINGNAGDNTLRGNGGLDSIYGQDGNDIISGGSDTDDLNGGDGNDKLRGLAGDDLLTGGNGDDILRGNVGSDQLEGGFGDDTLRGGRGDDTLSGAQGSDIFIGGTGSDVLTGGQDADTFVFNRAGHSTNDGSADEITDFEIGIDRIDLSGLNVDLTYIGGAGFSGTAGEVRVGEQASKSLVRVDIDGDGSADMKIVLTDTTGVTISDFIL